MRKIGKIILFIGVLLIIANVALLDWQWWTTKDQKTQNPTEITKEQNIKPDIPTCSIDCLKKIAEATLSAVATPPAQTKIVERVIQQVPAPAATKVFYLPIGGPGSTKSLDWVDVPNAQVYLTLSDYPNYTWVSWETFLKSDNAKVGARLFDVTHSIPVADSYIETNSKDYTLVSSPKLNLWSGNNLYRVQIKSQVGETASIDAARIKIVTK